MPALKWLPEALQDIKRLHGFIAEKSPEAAARAAASILAGADALAVHPQIGRPHPSGMREWLIRFGASHYVLRYRIDPQGDPVVVRVWHEREAR